MTSTISFLDSYKSCWKRFQNKDSRRSITFGDDNHPNLWVSSKRVILFSGNVPLLFQRYWTLYSSFLKLNWKHGKESVKITGPTRERTKIPKVSNIETLISFAIVKSPQCLLSIHFKHLRDLRTNIISSFNILEHRNKCS